jgi:tryptophan synthase alpha chain
MLSVKTQGFLYYVSLTGITGASLKNFSEVKTRLSAIRRMTDKPIAVGFGVSTPGQAKAMAGIADGVIVGSAIVRLMEEHMDDSDLPAIVAAFVKQLKQAVTEGRGRRTTRPVSTH